MSGAPGTSWAWRVLGRAGGLLLVVALAALGWLWHLDRARAWDTPGLGEPLVLLRGATAGTAAETWLVAVNPECAHCVQALQRLAARPVPGVRVGALVVDTPRRPDDALLGSLPGAPVWWDAGGAWRRRWGHRLYGELLCFDARGRFLRTRPPG